MLNSTPPKIKIWKNIRNTKRTHILWFEDDLSRIHGSVIHEPNQSYQETPEMYELEPDVVPQKNGRVTHCDLKGGSVYHQN